MPNTLLDPLVEQRLRGLRLARRIYPPRTLGLAAGGLCIGSALLTLATPGWVWMLWVLQIATWSHVAYWRAKRHASPYHAERQNLGIDSLLGGFWLAAMHFNLLPTIIVLTMISLNNIAVGGPRLLLRGVGLLALGGLLGMWLIAPGAPPIIPTTGVLLCSLPMLITYPLAIGYITYLQARQLSRQKRNLTDLSRTDGLTGLYNRRFWEAQIAAELLASSPAVIALIDIDLFKHINDEHGHGVGDETLRELATLLRQSLPPHFLLGRYGGEEFGVLMPATKLAQAEAALHAFQQRLHRHAPPAPLARMPTCSIGLAAKAPHMISHEKWLLLADQALYAAKDAGRDRLEVARSAASQSLLDLG
ncbi:diguanylate cyclase [Salinicola endophyticus]|uniref:diguanylate cyclase n=1 Tax=Salinicola endophyticus TaxID=1949083 RepID=A0ABY8FFR3_9GAMM|nr:MULTISPECIES: diguanylate cyclase [Salinicola]WFF41645.1 diguanylate cyclase [Salinicola endophyticus]